MEAFHQGFEGPEVTFVSTFSRSKLSLDCVCLLYTNTVCSSLHSVELYLSVKNPYTLNFKVVFCWWPLCIYPLPSPDFCQSLVEKQLFLLSFWILWPWQMPLVRSSLTVLDQYNIHALLSGHLHWLLVKPSFSSSQNEKMGFNCLKMTSY